MPQGLLDGLRVVEWGDLVAAPYCAKLLADLGAAVTKIESLPGGDSARYKGPFLPESSHPEASALFLYLNTNKQSMTLDLECETGREIIHRLLDGADIFVENRQPREMERLGLDFLSLHQRHPHLIVVSITSFGQSGPYRDYIGSDLVSFQMGGFGNGCPGAVEKGEEEPPLRAGGRQADFLSGVFGATGALHAWLYRKLNGEGVQVDVSEQEAVATMMYGRVATFSATGDLGSRLKDDTTTTRLTPCKDGWFLANFGDDRYWGKWIEVMGNPEWAQAEMFTDRAARRRNMHLARPLIEEWTMQHTKAEIHLLAQARRVPLLPTSTIPEVLESPQFQAREYFVEASNTDGKKVTVPGAPYVLSDAPWSLRLPAPRLGEHTEEILHDRLKLSDEQATALRQAGVV